MNLIKKREFYGGQIYSTGKTLLKPSKHEQLCMDLFLKDALTNVAMSLGSTQKKRFTKSHSPTIQFVL